MPPPLVCAVDIGTGSARAGIFAIGGQQLGRAERPIAMHRPLSGHAEHDSEDIWAAVSSAVRAARTQAGAAPGDIGGISFDATCSLVVRDAAGGQVSVSTTGEQRWDTIVWLDHRALAEADECTATGHAVLDYVGGAMSPEMQVPKLMWLKRHLPERWQAAAQIFDLADFLSWRATGSTARSQCALACKWTYLAHEPEPWRRDFFDAVGLADIFARAGLPQRASPVGTDLGPLLPEAAAALGLTTACRVGTGLIDAYAGAVGLLGGFAGDPSTIDRHLALIAGTSSCVMSASLAPRPLAGGWGPYLGAALPGLWISEGGQSATGALLDHLIRIHGGGLEPDAATHGRIVERIRSLRAEEGGDFASRLHVLPDFHGNRSPLADPHALGVISGLTLDASFDSLCRLYWRGCVAIALGIRQILEVAAQSGPAVDTLHLTGGHAKNPLLMELYPEVTGRTVLEPGPVDAVLLGTAMVAAAASGAYPDLRAACLGMAQPGRPRDPQGVGGYDRDYRIFLEMQRQRRALDAL